MAQSEIHILMANPIWRKFDWVDAVRAFSRALENTGKSIATKMAMIAITTSNLMSVNLPAPSGNLKALCSFNHFSLHPLNRRIFGEGQVAAPSSLTL